MPDVTAQEAERLIGGGRSVLEQQSVDSSVSVNVDASPVEGDQSGGYLDVFMARAASDDYQVDEDAETASLHSDSTDGGMYRYRGG